MSIVDTATQISPFHSEQLNSIIHPSLIFSSPTVANSFKCVWSPLLTIKLKCFLSSITLWEAPDMFSGDDAVRTFVQMFMLSAPRLLSRFDRLGRFKSGISSTRALCLSSRLVVNFGSASRGLPGVLGWPIKAKRLPISGQWPPELSPCPCLLAGTPHSEAPRRHKGDDEMITKLFCRSQKTCQRMCSQVQIIPSRYQATTSQDTVPLSQTPLQLQHARHGVMDTIRATSPSMADLNLLRSKTLQSFTLQARV